MRVFVAQSGSQVARTLVIAALLLLPACGLQPVYSGGSSGAVATALADIEVAPIANRTGYLVRQALREQMGPTGAAPHYRLEIELEDQILGFGIRANNTTADERVSLRARYSLKDASGKVVLLETTGSDVRIDRVSSDYAVVAAETSAYERLSVVVAQQITDRLSVFVRGGGPGPAPTR